MNTINVNLSLLKNSFWAYKAESLSVEGGEFLRPEVSQDNWSELLETSSVITFYLDVCALPRM